MDTPNSSASSTPNGSRPVSFFIDDLADGDALTLDDLDLFLAEERLNAELWNSENIDDSPPPAPVPNHPRRIRRQQRRLNAVPPCPSFLHNGPVQRRCRLRPHWTATQRRPS